VTLPQQNFCSVVHGLTPLRHGFVCILFQTTAGANTRRVLDARGVRVDVEYSPMLLGCSVWGLVSLASSR